MINRFLMFFLLFTLVSYPSVSPAMGKRAMKKPSTPVHILVEPVQKGMTSEDIRPGDIVDLMVKCVAPFDAEAMMIDIRLQGNIELITGDLHWQGRVKKNEEIARILSVRAPDKGEGSVTADVLIPLSKGTKFASSATFVLGRSVKKKVTEKWPVRKESTGRDILEFRPDKSE